MQTIHIYRNFQFPTDVFANNKESLLPGHPLKLSLFIKHVIPNERESEKFFSVLHFCSAVFLLNHAYAPEQSAFLQTLTNK